MADIGYGVGSGAEKRQPPKFKESEKALALSALRKAGFRSDMQGFDDFGAYAEYLQSRSNSLNDAERVQVRKDAMAARKFARKAASALVDGTRDETDVGEMKKVDRAQTFLIEGIDVLQDTIDDIDTFDPKEARKFRPTNVTANAGPDRPRFRDLATGEEVRAAYPNEPIASLWPSAERNGGATVGDFVVAAVTGRRDHLDRLGPEARAMNIASDSAGGYAVPAPLLNDFVEEIRNRSAIMRSGAPTFGMSTSTLDMVRIATGATAAWTAENTQIASSDLTLARIRLEAKKVAGLTTMSRELAEDSPNASAMVQASLAAALAEKIDQAALQGRDGSGPSGLAFDTTINSVDLTSQSGFANYDWLIDAIYENLKDSINSDVAIFSPRTWRDLEKLKETGNQPLVQPSSVAALRRLVTAGVTDDHDFTGSPANSSYAIVGDFRRGLGIGMRQMLSIEISGVGTVGSDKLFEQHMLGIKAVQRVDFQVLQPAALCRVIGITSN